MIGNAHFTTVMALNMLSTDVSIKPLPVLLVHGVSYNKLSSSSSSPPPPLPFHGCPLFLPMDINYISPLR